MSSRRLLGLAAKQGNAKAQRSLAIMLYNGEGGGVYSSTKVAEAHGAFGEIARWTLDEFGEVVARVVPANHAAECTKVESPEFAQKLLRAAQAGGSQF